MSEEFGLSKRDQRIFDRYFKLPPVWQAEKNEDQDFINETLFDLAVKFHCACQDQNKIIKGKEKNEATGQWQARLAISTQRVEAAKKDFWEARNIAKKAGYEVAERYSDYLPKNPYLLEI